jgi:hypothetical protein
MNMIAASSVFFGRTLGTTTLQFAENEPRDGTQLNGR